MGLFRKNPAEKKLKELTGGFLLSTDFVNRLKRNGLEIHDGTIIKEKLKDEIKQGLSAEEVPIRLNILINESKNQKNVPDTSDLQIKKCPNCGSSQEMDSSFCIDCGYEFKQSTNKNKKICPICRKEQDFNNDFCILCGYDFINKKINSPEKKCPNCDKSLNVSNRYCLDCGYDFETKKMPKYLKKCPKCGVLQKAENKFCRKCKENLEDVDYKICADLIECPNCNRKIPKDSKTCPFCKYDLIRGKPLEAEVRYKITKNDLKPEAMEFIDFKNRTAFLNTFNFNLKTCPDCGTSFLKADPFCFNCGASVLTHETVKNDSLEIQDGKLVSKDETKNDELSDLEALYSQTVKSKYSPLFKVAYTLYLEEFRKNPLKEFPDKKAKKYDTTVRKLKRQALEDEFIELASPLLAAKDSKVTELKEILKEHDLKVSGKKDELIERLGENLSDDELKKYFKAKNYQISEKGSEFLDNNNCILYIYANPDISRVFSSFDINKIFEERHYELDEIQDNLIDYLKKTFDEKLSNETWVDFKSYANAIAFIEEERGNLKDALNLRIKVFLFDLNCYSVILDKPEPKNTNLRKKDVSKLNELLHKLTLPIDELKELFSQSYNEVLFRMDIPENDALIYLLKVFGGEDLDSLSKEINETYSTPY